MSLVLDTKSQGQQEYGTFPSPNTTKSALCPICQSGTIEGIYLVPLSFNGLERAVGLRKSGSFQEAKLGSSSSNPKKPGDEESSEVQAEASYLMLSNNRSSLSNSAIADREQRTGRWTEEEISFVDYLVAAFDQGTLPLPHGVKLHEFLGDMLLCKSSRLTKKMKNAKLSTRSFVLCSPQSQSIHENHAALSALQENFLNSVSSEPTQLELRFNLTKQWRTHFSNLCVQIGYPYLDGKDWIASLEDMEQRANDAEELIRRVRRKRLGLALQTEGSNTSSTQSVYIGGVQADPVASQSEPVVSLEDDSRLLSNSEEGSDNQSNGDDDMFAMLEEFDEGNDPPEEQTQKRPRTRTFSEDFLQSDSKKPRSFSEDFDAVLNDLMDPEPASSSKARAPPEKSTPSHSCGPFLDAITMYMQSRNLPFQHADVWVPSFLPRDSNGPSKAVDTERLRLFHAGHATRGDVEESSAYSFREFGSYSDNFSFEPGHGLPGSVYSSGQIIWETGVDQKAPKQSERTGGAKLYGIKTAVGIPLNTPLVGRIVVAMYSRETIPENLEMAQDCANELMKYSPSPKWKLVIEMDDDPNKAVSSPQQSQTTQQIGQAVTQGGISQVSVPPRSFPTQVVGCTSPNGASPSQLDPEEQRIVTLLGEHMPLSDGSAGEPSSAAGSATNLLPHFMSIRLLLLRTSSRRTAQENEMIDVLKNSFKAYAKDNRRSGAELANLLAKDWVCLRSTYGLPTSAPAPSTHQFQQSHRRSSTDMPIINNHPHLMQVTYPPQSSSGPMNNPPGHFVSPPTQLGKVWPFWQ